MWTEAQLFLHEGGGVLIQVTVAFGLCKMSSGSKMFRVIHRWLVAKCIASIGDFKRRRRAKELTRGTDENVNVADQTKA